MRFSTRIARIIAIGAMTLVLGASLAAAQETFDPTADPGFGGWNFNEGVLPDPFIVSIIGGGSIDASTVDPLCNGYIAGAPDFRVNWNGSAPSLPAPSPIRSMVKLAVPDLRPWSAVKPPGNS